jgi:hypothetical protein
VAIFLIIIYTHTSQTVSSFVYLRTRGLKICNSAKLTKNLFPSSFTCITVGKISANTSAKFKMLTLGKSFILKKKNSV